MEVAGVKMMKECTFIHVIVMKKSFHHLPCHYRTSKIAVLVKLCKIFFDAIVYLCIFSKDVDFLSVSKLRAFISRLNFARHSSLNTYKNVRVLGTNTSASSKTTIGLDV